jgi:hypothetical protein
MPHSSYPAWRDGLSRLREDLPLDEAFIQRIWFEELFRNPLKTLEGEPVTILRPGFWNHGAGPDFLHATLQTPSGGVEAGAIEIHATPQDWPRHRHDQDPRYNPVILHLVWQAGTRDFFPKTTHSRAVRQAELCTQLKVPFDHLREAFATTRQERSAGARAGRCRQALARLEPAALEELLEEAGWWRYQRKIALWKARREAMDFNQALWLGLAEALGYSENKESFQVLARRLPIAHLLKQRAGRAEALLYGCAGLLPRRLPTDRAGAAFRHLRGVWDLWWKLYDGHETSLLPDGSWRLAGLRPLNRPERRLAVLALLSQSRTAWKEFLFTARQGDPAKIHRHLASLSHPYWRTHATAKARPMPMPAALIGPNRSLAFCFNSLWPLLELEGLKGTREKLGATRGMESNRYSRIVATRLLPQGLPRKMLGRLLVQEGLIQIYQDFCAGEILGCGACPFPEHASRPPST